MEGVAGQLAALRPLLGGEEIALHGALCFTDASWGLFAKPFRIDGVWVSWPDALAGQIAAPGPLAPEHLRALAARLDGLLRPA